MRIEPLVIEFVKSPLPELEFHATDQRLDWMDCAFKYNEFALNGWRTFDFIAICKGIGPWMAFQ